MNYGKEIKLFSFNFFFFFLKIKVKYIYKYILKQKIKIYIIVYRLYFNNCLLLQYIINFIILYY
ncbi:hypothetical protein U3516DRAFT_210933 [Neocallimastix sp. 'constans']